MDLENMLSQIYQKDVRQKGLEEVKRIYCELWKFFRYYLFRSFVFLMVIYIIGSLFCSYGLNRNVGQLETFLSVELLDDMLVSQYGNGQKMKDSELRGRIEHIMDVSFGKDWVYPNTEMKRLEAKYIPKSKEDADIGEVSNNDIGGAIISSIIRHAENADKIDKGEATVFNKENPSQSYLHSKEENHAFSYSDFLRETKGLTPALFFHNLYVSTLCIILGLFPILPLGFMGFLVNMIGSSSVLGFFASFFGMDVTNIIIYGILPHGIFEIPAFVLATALGIKLCFYLTAWMFRRERSLSFKTLMVNYGLIYIFVIVPMLLLAGLIETTITPILLDTFVTIF